MNRRKLTLREAFRGFGERKTALQKEVGIDEAEWELVAILDKGPLTEMQLSYNWTPDQRDLCHLLSGLVGKGYIAADNGASRSDPVFALTELGSARLATLRTRFGVMIRERLLFVDPVKLRAIHRVIKTFMAQNGISLTPRLRRFH